MGREIKDGLILDKSFFLIDEKKQGFGIIARVIQILAIILGGWCFAFLFRQSMDIPIHVLQIYIAIIIITGIMVTLCLIPSYNLVKLFFALLFYGLYFYSRLPRIMNGFYIVENLALRRMAEYYNYITTLYQADYTTQTEDMTLLLIMVLLPVIALLSIAVIKNRFAGLCSILLFLPIALCLLFGIIPLEKYLITFVAVVLYLLRSGFSFRHISSKEQYTMLHRINSKAAVWLSLMGIGIFFFLKLFITDQGYDNISEIRSIKLKIQNTYLNFTLGDISDEFTKIKLFFGDVPIGGLQGGELGKEGEVKYTNSKQLIIKVPYESAAEGIYLKGYVGSEYTGSSWEGLTGSDRKKYKEMLNNLPSGQFVPVNQSFVYLRQQLMNNISDSSFYTTSSNNQVYQGTCEIEYKNANRKYMYAPYFTNFALLENTSYKQDLYVAPKKRSGKYEFNYFFNANNFTQMQFLNGTTAQISDESEEVYREYVYQVYTQLPKEGLDQLKQDFSTQNLKQQTLIDKLQYVYTYLNNNTEYTLSPGKLPKGKDFVEYFLYENKKGYCAHYASAAALMLRAMGVPTRYVEGYVIYSGESSLIPTSGQQTVTTYYQSGTIQEEMPVAKLTVSDYNAHAWTEIYIDGYGWCPVDFTPSSAVEFNTAQTNNSTHNNSNSVSKPTKVPVTPTPAVKDQKKKADTNKTKKPTASSNITDLKQRPKLDQIFILAFIVLAVTVGIVSSSLVIRRRRKIRNTRNRNKVALFLYRETEKIISFGQKLPGKGAQLEDCESYIRESAEYIDSESFEAFMEVVRKARFGKGSITPDELKTIERFRTDLYSRVSEKLPIFKKVFLKFILLM